VHKLFGGRIQSLMVRVEQTTKPNNMKFLVILALVALVACEPESEAKAGPESDAESWYGFGYPSTFYRGSHYPFYNYHQTAYPVIYNPAMTARFIQPYNRHFVQPYNRYYANSGGALHVVKREAEADSEADSEADAEASPESWYNGVYGHPYQHHGFYNDYTYGQRYPVSAYSRYPTTAYSRYPTTATRYPTTVFSRYPNAAYSRYPTSAYSRYPTTRYAF